MTGEERVRARLLEAYSADEVGVWQIYGEDPNCDFGGPHHEPHLKTFEGRYADAIAHALTLRGFFTWGGGGRIERGGIAGQRGGFTPPTGPAEPRPARFSATIVPSPRPEVEPPLEGYHDLLNYLCDQFHIPGSPTFREAVAYIKGMIAQAGQRR